jgi:hypothetical protein
MTAHLARNANPILGLAIWLALTGLPGLLPTALANGRFPQAGQIATDPAGSGRLVVRATFGLLVSEDAGQSWGWVCEAAPGYQDATDPYVLQLGAGKLAVATTTGLVQSADLGCSWLPAAGLVGSGAVADLVAQSKAGEALALYAGAPDPQSGLLAPSVWQTSDAGASWQPFGQPLPPLVQVLTVEVAASEPQVVYVSGVQAAGGKPRNVLVQTVNSGKTWQVTAVPGSGTPWLAAVDPTNAKRVWLRRSAPGLGDSLARSDDGGATWTEVFAATGSMRGFALSPDGSQWLAGVVGSGSGLYLGTTASAAPPQQLDKRAIHCLRWTGAEIYACGADAEGFALARRTGADGAWQVLLRHQDVSPRSCQPGSLTADLCPSLWPGIAQQIGAVPAKDPTATPEVSDGGCHAGPGSSGLAGPLAGLLLAILALRYGRKKRPTAQTTTAMSTERTTANSSQLRR